jgi:hypothetical protein
VLRGAVGAAEVATPRDQDPGRDERTSVPKKNGAAVVPELDAIQDASGGAKAPPRNLTPEYALDATGRGRSVASIETSVRTVLRTPRNRPPTTTSVMRAGALPWRRPMSSSVSVSAGMTRRSTLVRRIRAVSSGATNTDVTASASPQPKKIQPSVMAFDTPSGTSANGVHASRTKKPML